MRRGSFSISQKKVHFSQPDISLPMGSLSIAQQFFHHDIPSPYEVEMAIAAIEDNIQATPQLHQIAPEFDCYDIYLQQIAQVTGAGKIISQSEIEKLFNRVADVISGSPKHEGEFPDDKYFISYLLIIRELSHHLKIQKINRE